MWRAKPGRVAKAVLVGAVPPIMLRKEANPGGLLMEVFNSFRAALVANRPQLITRSHDRPKGLRLTPALNPRRR